MHKLIKSIGDDAHGWFHADIESSSTMFISPPQIHCLFSCFNETTSDEQNESEWENLEQSACRERKFNLTAFLSPYQLHTLGFDPQQFTVIVRGKSELINQ